MKTFSINTLGCKVNQYESQQIRQLLEQLGLSSSDTSKGNCELVVINTCCVTHTASAKSRQYIRKMRKLNPAAEIVVAGCLPAVQIDEIDDFGTKTHLISDRNNLAATLIQVVNGKTKADFPQAPQNTTIRTKTVAGSKSKLPIFPVIPQLTSFKGQTRAFLKVQDGCDGYCSYCIIPKARPIVHSKPVDKVLEEAQLLVNAGHKEIVITGIFLGAYGMPSVRRNKWPGGDNDELANLLEKMAQIPDLHRIRMSSLEPADVTERLLDVLCANRNIMPHIHLSLQSGSDRVLKRMCRQYTSEVLVEKISLIKSRLDRPAITCDLIVGFPGETDEDFENTVRIASQTGFARMHVFSFSTRKGTAAAKMQPLVKKEVMQERSRILRELDKKLASIYRSGFLGQRATILTEETSGKTMGRTERYFAVYLNGNGEKPKRNELIEVKLVENTEDGMIGEAV